MRNGAVIQEIAGIMMLCPPLQCQFLLAEADRDSAADGVASIPMSITRR